MPIFGVTASSNMSTKLTDFYQIATTTVGSGGTSSVTFSSIPQTYTHLQLRMITRTDRSSFYLDYLKTTFNSDNGANYTTHHLSGDGANAGAYGAGSQNFSQILRLAGAASPSISNTFGVAVVDILDYTNTNKHKTLRNIGGTDFNGAGELGLYSGAWLSTSAINTITLTVGGGTSINQYSSFQLYGVKA
jgi:hypothetical protein